MVRKIAALSPTLALALGATCLAPLAAAQTPTAEAQTASAAYVAPRTSAGHPSLEGVWNQNFLILMESTPQTPMLVVPEPAAKAMATAIARGISASFDKNLDPEVPALMRDVDGLPLVQGQRRTRSVVQPDDGKLPYTAAARAESNKGYGFDQTDNPEERPNWERCVTSLGLPPISGMFTTNANPRRIVQTPDAVVIHTEYGDEARIIPFSVVHKPEALHSWLGDSIARWEGETLVIESIGLPQNDRIRAFSNLIVPANSAVTERYTRVSENELLYQYTVEHADTYTSPWLAEYSVYKTDQRMFEHACHEGNYSLPNIMKAARINENRSAKPK